MSFFIFYMFFLGELMAHCPSWPVISLPPPKKKNDGWIRQWVKSLFVLKVPHFMVLLKCLHLE